MSEIAKAVTPDGIVTVVKVSQFPKASWPIFVTLDGIVILFNFLQPEKASCGISVMP